jgi:hypothetical protein
MKAGSLVQRARRRLELLREEFSQLQRNTIELADASELKKVFGWDKDPVIDRPDVNVFEYPDLDVNQRRLRDAQSIATVARNARAGTIVEIGTAEGLGTALIALNAPSARVYTVNIPPEDIERGEGGELTTIAMQRDAIGRAYRERGLTNVTQILQNTATWKPDLGRVDLAVIDGCHDTEFVYSDTAKILACAGSGTFILWHDFNLELVRKFDWIRSVCLGVERLYRNGLLKGKMYHVRDSWVGVYRVQ